MLQGMRLTPFLFACLGGATSGCVTVVTVQCDSGFCGIPYTPARRHTPAEILVSKKGEQAPPNAMYMARLTSPEASDAGCSPKVLEKFRSKAALLGYDGVGDIGPVDVHGRRGCSGRTYILVEPTP